MTVMPNTEGDTTKLSEENIKNFNKQDDTSDGKKWVSCEISRVCLNLMPLLIHSGI